MSAPRWKRGPSDRWTEPRSALGLASQASMPRGMVKLHRLVIEGHDDGRGGFHLYAVFEDRAGELTSYGLSE